MVQYGFYFDPGRCATCHTCTVACKDWNGVPPGPAKWIRIYKWEEGAFPTPRLNVVFATCYHCQNPVCLDACPNHAIYKEEKYGAVLIDHQKCKGARQCYLACPYGSVMFQSDAFGTQAEMCTMCIDRLEQGDKPICVMACNFRALDFGPLSELKAKYGTNSQLAGMPSPTLTQPSIIFKPRDAVPRKQLLPYDTSKALTLFAQRPDGLTPNYASASDVTTIPSGLIKRNKLVLKPGTAAEIMEYTKDDEG